MDIHYDRNGYMVEEREGCRFVIPKQRKMRTEGIIFSDQRLIKGVLKDGCSTQVANVAHLPGIVGCALAMPDIHQGYGFPIGGVAAFDGEDGIVSPGGVGYDINCGVRLYLTDLASSKLLRREKQLADAIYNAVPCGVGSKRKDIKDPSGLMDRCLTAGAEAAIDAGFGSKNDLLRIEAGGRIEGANPRMISSRAIERGRPQLGTLGSGNHFVELGVVSEIYDETVALAFGVQTGRVTVAIHTGSRGFGHQVCGDYLKTLAKSEVMRKYDIPDRQLCCARIDSPEGQNYLAAMSAAANYAFANRQIIGHFVKKALFSELNRSEHDMKFSLLYDLAHNIAKFENHIVDNVERRLLIHRKGATRAFPPGHDELKDPAFFEHGQPVFIPGDMGRYSYICAGTKAGAASTFGSSAHGAGRTLSRSQAKKTSNYQDVIRDLKKRGVQIRAASKGSVVEEAPRAYKDVADVIEVVRGADIGKPIARIRPLIVVKG